MNIDFTKEEFRALLDMVTLGDWVITSHDTQKDPAKEIYAAVLQKVFSRAEEFGYGDLVVFDPELQEFFETRDYEESEKEEFIDEYDSNTFWDQLISRLAERDVVREQGLERAMSMSPEDRLRELHKHEMKYSDEFEAHGIERIRLDGH